MFNSKILHKVLLILLKYIPIIIGLGYMLNTILLFFGIDLAIISLFTGLSVLPWLFIFISSFVFKFCLYHRIFLYYILIIDTINWIDYLIGIPISTLTILAVEAIIAGIALITTLILYVKCNKRISC